jgi:hypothetical protein
MDLAMVKQEQGETLHKYMHRFFDKRATVVDVTDKEVIDLFQDGLFHRRTFEDFGRRHPKSIPHLKDMIMFWADEEDKANTKYDAIRGNNKQNAGGSSGNNGNQGGRNNNNNSGPNRKRKPNNTVAAIQRPAKENLSVRNVVPTLTSNKRQGLSLNGRCQAIRYTRFILVPAGGRTSSSGVLEALYCSAPGVPVVRLLQARWERRRGLQVPGEVAEDVVRELEKRVCGVSYVVCCCPLSPAAGEFASLL